MASGRGKSSSGGNGEKKRDHGRECGKGKASGSRSKWGKGSSVNSAQGAGHLHVSRVPDIPAEQAVAPHASQAVMTRENVTPEVGQGMSALQQLHTLEREAFLRTHDVNSELSATKSNRAHSCSRRGAQGDSRGRWGQRRRLQ
jgi:hypothetical protein